MRYITMGLCFLSLLLGQNNDVTVLASFDSFEKIQDGKFYLAWELPIDTKKHQSFYNFKSLDDESYLMFDHLLSNPDHSVLFMSFDGSKTSLDMVATFKGGKQGIFKRKKLYWMGLQDIDASYAFIKSMMTKIDKPEKMYGLLNAHQKNAETLAFYKNEYGDSNSNRERKNLIFWIGNVKTVDAAKELDRILATDIPTSLKEKVMFAYSNNRTEYALKRLIDISKNDKSRAVRKKAKFWLASSVGRHMEKSFSNEVYTAEELELKRSAIFALYNMKDYDSLKDIAQTAKDIRLRKKAIFWLGQIERTPVDFFETLLNL